MTAAGTTVRPARAGTVRDGPRAHRAPHILGEHPCARRSSPPPPCSPPPPSPSPRAAAARRERQPGRRGVRGQQPKRGRHRPRQAEGQARPRPHRHRRQEVRPPRTETAGRPTLLFFGYTHCPDVCPLTMSTSGLAVKQLPQAEQDEAPGRLRHHRPGSGHPRPRSASRPGAPTRSSSASPATSTPIQAAARPLGISIDPPTQGQGRPDHHRRTAPRSSPSPPKSDAGYVLYGKDATVEDYTKDLPKLIKGENP
ncbi:hypothetical protein SANTM175S_01132 [Streptomyces antimycoticus]